MCEHDIEVGCTVRQGRVIGTVRAIHGDEARWDNGDPANDDLMTNGFTTSRWTPLRKLKRVTARAVPSWSYVEVSDD